jgi:hypothetical protein
MIVQSLVFTRQANQTGDVGARPPGRLHAAELEVFGEDVAG